MRKRMGHFPMIGHIQWWERLLGWQDIRCQTCGTIGGAGKGPNSSAILACLHCEESDWLRSLPRKPPSHARRGAA